MSNQVHLTVLGSACVVADGRQNETIVDHVDVNETGSAVTVTAYTTIRNPSAAGNICADVALILKATAQLARPLGDRAIHDGSCHDAIVLQASMPLASCPGS